MKCVRCLEPLISKCIESIGIEECQFCGGVWFDGGELNALKDQVNPDLNWMDMKVPELDPEAIPVSCFDWLLMDYINTPSSAHPHSCPKCAEPFLPLIYNGTSVEVDFCHKCEGIWLDRGEFGKIILELESRMHSMTVADCARESLREAKEIFTGRELVVSEWRDFLTLIRILHRKALSERSAIASALEVMRCASLSFH